MTDAPRTMQLAPAHWRQLALLNIAQLHDFVSSIPAHTETGASALTPEVAAVISDHLAEGRAFLTAWASSRMPALAAPAKPAEAKVAQQNGADLVKPKGKGGWPLGKPRKPKATAETQQ